MASSSDTSAGELDVASLIRSLVRVSTHILRTKVSPASGGSRRAFTNQKSSDDLEAQVW
jgi:hypothetical protein